MGTMIIAREEVLRYLGYKNQNIDNVLEELINDSIQDITNLAKPLSTYQIFEIEEVTEGIKVLGTNLILKGQDIVNHLKNAKKCCILAATLGVQVDNRIRYLEINQMTKALVQDACATAAIERVCDELEAEIIQVAKAEGFGTNYRYSPGYGDFPITIQSEILAVLDAPKRIGLTCSESAILLPRKSVTAIIGFIDEKESNPIENHRSCSNCRIYSSCTYRRDGISCDS